MRVMVLVKASELSEAGALPTEKELAAMMKFNDQLVEAGVMLAAEGLQPSSRGKRVKFTGGEPTIIDGPFAGSRELVAGFWIWRVRSMEEAVAWIERAPFERGAEVALRPIFEADDFGEALTPELRAQEERQRARLERQRKDRGR